MAIRTARLDMRMEPDQKALLEQAAALEGQDVTAFAMSTLVGRAQDVLQKAHTTVLSQKAFESFLGILKKDTPPTPALKAVMKRLKKVRER